MFRLLSVLLFPILGFAAGIWYERHQMRSECSAGAGQWTGTICVNSDLLQ
jgi:hypothetical protein